MRVLVTGGTGFVGTHTVAALLDAGHDVKLLVRSPERVGPALAALGVDRELETVAGDVTEPETVERAIDGCEAAIHGASVFTMDARKGDVMRRVNVAGTQTVLSAAVRRGLDPIVLVSSELSLLPTDGRVLAPDSPVPPPERYPYWHRELVRRKWTYKRRGRPGPTTDRPGGQGPHRPVGQGESPVGLPASAESC